MRWGKEKSERTWASVLPSTPQMPATTRLGWTKARGLEHLDFQLGRQGLEYLGCHLGGSQMLCITQESTGSGDRTQTQALGSCPRHWLNSLYMCRWPLHYWFEYPWWLMMMSIFNILTICVSFWVEMSIFWVVSFYCWVATVLCTC